MNRDIEFRAYIKNENIMINVPIIDFRKSAKCIRTIYGQTNASEWKYKFDDIILMQYTGLKDKNGKKIFEGDIVLINGKHTDEVIFECGCFLMKKQLYNYEFTYQNFDNLEVIGNIYENKELLEV